MYQPIIKLSTFSEYKPVDLMNNRIHKVIIN